MFHVFYFDNAGFICDRFTVADSEASIVLPRRWSVTAKVVPSDAAPGEGGLAWSRDTRCFYLDIKGERVRRAWMDRDAVDPAPVRAPLRYLPNRTIPPERYAAYAEGMERGGIHGLPCYSQGYQS